MFHEIVEAEDFNKEDSIRNIFGTRNDKFREFLFDNMVYKISAVDGVESKVTKEKLSESFGELFESEQTNLKNFHDLGLLKDIDLSSLQDNRNSLRKFLSSVIVGDEENPNFRMDYMKALFANSSENTQEARMLRNLTLAIVRVACKEQIENEDGISTKEFLYLLDMYASS